MSGPVVTSGYTDEQIEELTNGASRGNWGVTDGHLVVGPDAICVATTHRWGDDGQEVRDAWFIAAARTLVPSLLERSQRAERRIKEASQVLDEWADAIRGDWGGIDGRSCRRELEAISAHLAGDTDHDMKRLRHEAGICPDGGGHWPWYCADYDCPSAAALGGVEE